MSSGTTKPVQPGFPTRSNTNQAVQSQKMVRLARNFNRIIIERRGIVLSL